MDFSKALVCLKDGQKVRREDWKNANFVFLVKGSTFTVNRAPLNEFYPEGTEVTYRPHIDMVGTDGSIGTWAPSSVDVFAEDWIVVD